MEPVWTKTYLLNEARALAEKADKPLSIEFFWKVADRELAGNAPVDLPGLAARAKNYVVFDMAIAEHGVAGDPDIDASIKRKAVLEQSQATLTNPEVFLQFFCRTNLLFLGREIFNKAFTFSTHARVCNFFVQKNPVASLDDQDTTKERLLLYPRGGFKSTVDEIDCVQWIINFPDIRILILTAAVDLATAFIGGMKNYFILPLGAQPTLFQELFPAFVIPKRSDGAEDQFICPCRTLGDAKKREPTAWAASILSNLPGWHCDLMKGDDTVNDKNADTIVLVNKVIKKIDYAESLIDPGGYKDLLGTPYAPGDLYTHTVLTTEAPGDLLVLTKPAWWLKTESMHKEERDCVDADYELLFETDKFGKTRLDHKFLRSKRRKNPSVFNSQYLLNPAGMKKIQFTMDMLRQRTISRDQLPHKLIYYILWDFAYGAHTNNDYSVGAVIGIDEENRVYVVEIYRDRYLDSELARVIVASNKQYAPRLVAIENSNGAQLLQSTIRRYSEEAGVSFIPLDFFKVDVSLNAKATRIGALQPLLNDARLFFLDELTCLEDLYLEFKDFGSSDHDDIPDAISHVHRILPSNQSSEPGGPGGRERVQRLLQILREKDLDNLIFQEGPYAPVIPQAPIEEESGTGDEIYDPYGIPGM